MSKEEESYEVIRTRNYKTTFSGAGAEFVLMDLMRYCNMDQTSFKSFEPHETAYNEGKRAVYLYISNVLKNSELEVHSKIQKMKDAPLVSDAKPDRLGIVSDFSKGLYE